MQIAPMTASQPSEKRVIALIVAAGESRRAGGEVPKQYQLLGGKSLLRRSIEAFQQHPGVQGVKVVIHPTHQYYYDAHTKDLNLLPSVTGGTTRQESVKRGLMDLENEAIRPDYVLIHDAARPNVGQDLITQTLLTLESAQAVIPALPVIDTLKHVEKDQVVGTIERRKLFRAQTPQGFHFDAILAAHRNYSEYECTDDAAIAEHAGLEVKIVTGSEHNYKITTQEDLRDAQALLAGRFETRVGSGFDVHRLVAFDAGAKQVVSLCGVEVPSALRLEGHSDADVGLHAVVDAMLGAMAEGDIGLHFPPSDARWKGASSARFVAHAHDVLKQKQGSLVHVDVTLICEKPRISEYREAMREALATLLDLPVSRVSVKATTTEKLGFTGRSEGIAAQAVVTIRLPTEACA